MKDERSQPEGEQPSLLAAREIVPACLSRTCFIRDCSYDHCWGCEDSEKERQRVANIIQRYCQGDAGAIAQAHKIQGDAVIDAHLLRVENESLRKQLAHQAPVEWGADKPNFWAGAWKYHTEDQCLEMCVARPEMALAYMDELRAAAGEGEKKDA